MLIDVWSKNSLENSEFVLILKKIEYEQMLNFCIQRLNQMNILQQNVGVY